MKNVIGALALVLFGAGCSGSDGFEGDAEDVGKVEFALSNTSWADTGPLPQDFTLSNPVSATKKSTAGAYINWTFAQDNLTNIRYSIFDKAANTNTAWTILPGTAVMGNSAPEATSWNGCNGAPNRNIAVAWIDPSGNAKVSFSKPTNATNISATPVDLGGGNAAQRPALVYSIGKLLLITMNAANNNYRFKWAQISCAGDVFQPWSGWINFPAKAFSGGAGAATVTNTPPTAQVGVVGVGSTGCVNNLCPAFMTRINIPQAQAAAPTFFNNVWAQVPSTFPSGSTMSLVQKEGFAATGAYVVARNTTDTNVRVALTTNASNITGAWTNMGSVNCSPVFGSPTLSLQEFTFNPGAPAVLKFRLNVACNPSAKVRFSLLSE